MGLCSHKVKVIESEEWENKISRSPQLLGDAPTEHRVREHEAKDMKL